MKLLYIGAGFVGTCSAAVSADGGHNVLVYDIDAEKIKKLGSGDRDAIESCLFEKGLADLLTRNAERISFINNYTAVEKFLNNCDAVFMCLPTPEKSGSVGETDLSFYEKAAEELAGRMALRNEGRQEKYIIIVNKSTVPIGMADITKEILEKRGVKNFGVVANPEFLAEGRAVEGSLKPSRVVIGAWQERDFKIMREIYSRFYGSPEVVYLEVNPREAAAGKLLANFLLLSRLVNTYDVVGRVSESFSDVKFENICRVVSTDERIGQWGFYNSVSAGGGCLLKDASSLRHQLRAAGILTNQIDGVLSGNNFQKENFYNRARQEAKFSWPGKTAAILGVAFKQGTNDVRNSSAVELIVRLLDDGVKKIKIYDPAATPSFQNVFNPAKDARYKIIQYCDSEKETLAGSEACLVLTDWPEFKSIGDVIKTICPPPYLIMDGRRMLAGQFEELAAMGYDIIAVGSPFYKGKK